MSGHATWKIYEKKIKILSIVYSNLYFQTVESPPNQVAVFNPDRETWVLRKVGGSVPPKRASAAMATGKDGIFMYGGVSTEE